MLHSSRDDLVELIRQTAAEHQHDPAVAIGAFLDVCIDAVEATNGGFGCPITPAVLESPDPMPSSTPPPRRSPPGRTRWPSSWCAAASSTAGPGALAAVVIAAVEGAFVLSRATRGAGPLRDVKACLEALVAAN
jgi:hypothetical protein